MRKQVFVFVFVFMGSVLLALGCGGSGTGGDAGNQGTGGSNGGGTGGRAGGAGGRSSIDPTPFLGAWTQAQTFTLSGSCAGIVPSAAQTTAITVSAGTSSDLVMSSSPDDGCSYPFRITSATEATLVKTTQCTVNGGSLGNVTGTFDTWTITVSGNAGTESGAGAISSPACPFSMTGTLSR